MQFLAKDLKQFFNSIKHNKINQISIKSKKLEITVNRQNHLINKVKSKSLFNTIQSLNESTKFKKKSKKNHKHQLPFKPIVNINKEQNEAKIYSTIISPMVGTFYQAAGPNEPPFIKTGDHVEKKQIVCIIEAMKLMNEIEAEVTGEIVEILVNDGDIVDCGQALIKVKL